MFEKLSCVKCLDCIFRILLVHNIVVGLENFELVMFYINY